MKTDIENDLMEFVIENEVLESTAFVKDCKQKVQVEFDHETVTWVGIQCSREKKVLKLRDILVVRPIFNKKSSCDQNDFKQFRLYYVERSRKGSNKLKCRCVKLEHQDPGICRKWVDVLANELSNIPGRIKRFLVFVNPFGGKRNAMKIFNRYGKPLFQLAGVDVSVIVSQSKNQISDLIMEYNLDVYDAVGCVGGDGTLSEVINGLVLRECQLRGINPNDTSVQLPIPKHPVGIIPGGSTDTTAYCIHGTTDPKTAVLQILRGTTVGVDLVSVHNDKNQLLKLYVDVLSYGYLGDVAHYSESFRWMGPTRYEYTGLKKIVQNSGYHGELEMLIDSNQEVSTKKCYEDCQSCNSSNLGSVSYTWKTLKGKFFMVSCANITCAGQRNPQGLAPFAHLGDGHVNIIVIHHTSLFRNLRILQRMTSREYDLESLPELDVFRAKEFRFKASPDSPSSRWNCDGEVIVDPNVHGKVHCRLVKIFGTGPVRPSTKTCC